MFLHFSRPKTCRVRSQVEAHMFQFGASNGHQKVGNEEKVKFKNRKKIERGKRGGEGRLKIYDDFFTLFS